MGEDPEVEGQPGIHNNLSHKKKERQRRCSWNLMSNRRHKSHKENGRNSGNMDRKLGKTAWKLRGTGFGSYR